MYCEIPQYIYPLKQLRGFTRYPRLNQTEYLEPSRARGHTITIPKIQEAIIPTPI